MPRSPHTPTEPAPMKEVSLCEVGWCGTGHFRIENLPQRFAALQRQLRTGQRHIGAQGNVIANRKPVSREAGMFGRSV